MHDADPVPGGRDPGAGRGADAGGAGVGGGGEHPDITKAAGKTVKGKESGSVKVIGYDEQNGQIIIRAEIDQPKDVVPAGQNNFNPFGFGGGFGGGGIQIMPQILPVQPAPALSLTVKPLSPKTPAPRSRPTTPNSTFSIPTGNWLRWRPSAKSWKAFPARNP